MKKILLGLFIFGLTTQINAQTIELPETIISVNYKYLDAVEEVDADNTPARVKKLEQEVLKFDNKDMTSLYDDEYETYTVSFFVPEGRIIAAYNKDGKIIRTIEKYNNVRLPLEVMQSVSKRFPNWGIVEDVYFINYHCERDSIKQVYKIKLKNDDKFLTIKTDENGTFL
ncbi:MAG: nicotinate-nucleotide adenylyltransferase [Flavobacteriaceae bacterium]|nr:nicotinate-nucleotide adenylyltransferase [Flavobacteriaceae bacterium]